MFTYKIIYDNKLYKINSNNLNYAVVMLISHLNIYIPRNEIKILEKIKISKSEKRCVVFIENLKE